ncbi:MAG: bifunctional diaminohydroxyphosphoribosylaminopyrimidine deaminase/5-amino-6-(5-phosphoribosylamino)uracil reductase RibD [Candidatus Omnitrophica bacterium]|nr:bifunctional diaminohydroxyphosphoribosylaminopyrimidine deaminase/5-amino-6-(5-phosphoribosylamino)uracil reductase RibD [Candidatus Omnitrophota bacterium]
MLNTHEHFMREAIRLARRAKGKTYPNPAVGAVVVNDKKIISKDYHKKCGLPHAEALALAKAREKAKGASLYVTLEPCAHHGKTPPCVSAIIKSGIKKVYVGIKDPNPLVNGKGIKMLRNNNISVRVGICRSQAEKLNIDYIKKMQDTKAR